MVAKHDPAAIYIEREYEAPLRMVWEAWTDPEQAAKWWGPRGFTLTTHSKDLRPGGVWWYTMHGPDGVDYPNKTLYLEVEECRKLVYDHGGYDDRPPLFRVTVLFSESQGKTTMKMWMKLPTVEQAEATRKFVKQVGGNATWDRLAEYVGEMRDHLPRFVINRSFPAARPTVFNAWVDVAQLSRWLPPPGFDMEIVQGEIAVGKTALIRMTNRAEVTFYCQFEYLEIDAPRRIVYRQRFCDAQGGPAHHPALPVFPETLTNSVVFTDEDDGQTRVTLTTEISHGVPTDALQAFLETRSGMTLGWSHSFDALESRIAGVSA